MARLTAVPNPVGVESPTGTCTTTVTWDPQSAAPGRVFLAVGDAAPTLFAGGTVGARTGSRAQGVEFGRVYAFTLLQESNNAPLASLTVTVVDRVAERIRATLAALELRDRVDPPQAITGLQAIPGVVTVDVSFRTNRATIPLIRVLDSDGTVLASSWPAFHGPARSTVSS